MKYNLIKILFILIGYCSFGQIKEIYMNDDLVNIVKSEFEKKTQEKTYNLRFDLDTLIVNVKVKKIKKGRISASKLDSIKKTLTKTTNKKIAENILVINYHPGLDRCFSNARESFLTDIHGRYLKRIKKFDNVNQFFIYKSVEGTEKCGEKLKWFPDRDNLIERTFFPINYPCGSFVLIDENGNYYITKGEYNLDEIFRLIKKKEKTFANNTYK